MQQTCIDRGASPEAIQHHYDVGNDFYRLWLDPTMCYSCALWDEHDTDDLLERAQRRKIEHHVRRAHVGPGGRVLDVGCGWGAVLKHVVEDLGVRQAVGLTLSQAQADWIASYAHPGIEVRLENWADHRPDGPYDAIISVGAFEHFARPEWDDPAKIAVYRAFFLRCHDWLKPDGWLSLQTIAYGNIDRRKVRTSSEAKFIVEEIFPESELPTLEQICQACDGLFELALLQNDREDYARTCRVWSDRLRAARRQAVTVAGEATFTRYRRYLKLCAALFHYGQTGLLRIAFRRLDEPRR
ncbi:MAG: class I SAM-dependent methyltransferase [Gemmataceae bacterium]